MLARVLAIGLCTCVSYAGIVRVTGIVSKPYPRRVDIWHMGFPRLTYTVLMKFGYLQNKSISLWNFVAKSGLTEFGHNTHTVAECDKQFDSRRLLLITPDSNLVSFRPVIRSLRGSNMYSWRRSAVRLV